MQARPDETPAQIQKRLIKTHGIDPVYSYVPRLIELEEISEQQDYQRLAEFMRREMSNATEDEVDRAGERILAQTITRKMQAFLRIEESKLVYVTIKLEPRSC